jgi:4,5:9,10-diseco-3-hydroxy-5,9,17-trioxoandrosta-1(10),2-diene-4-oate hydrolase
MIMSAVIAPIPKRNGARMLKASEVIAKSPSPLEGDRLVAWRRSDLAIPSVGNIALFECGKQDAQAPVALLVHGLGHWTQGAWDPIAALLQATHRVIAFDLPGFGASDKPDARYDLPFFIATLHGIVQARNLRRFILVGHSLGGMIAADYAGTYPAEIEMLTLLAPAGFLRTPKIFVRIVAGEPAARLFSLRPSRRFVRELLEQTFYDKSLISEETYEHGYELSQDPLVCRAFLRVYAGALRDFLDPPGFHARLARYAGPTLLVWGRQDEFIPTRALANARKIYPHADVLLLEHCGHSPNIEMPIPVVQRMLSGPAPRVIFSRELTAVQYAVPPGDPKPRRSHADVQEAIAWSLSAWACERNAGRVRADWEFDLTPPGGKVHRLIPDVAYLSYDRIRREVDDAAMIATEAPNVVFEVLSPGQKIEELADTIRLFLASGCELAVIIDPHGEFAVLYDHSQVQRLDGEHRFMHPALPGFNVRLSSFFEEFKPKAS